jgi:hypothetical protein
MEFTEERLPQRLEIGARRARLGSLEGKVLPLRHCQARKQQE